MPFRSRNYNRPSIYLDWADLQNMLDADLSIPKSNPDLKKLLRKLSESFDLVVSISHFYDIWSSHEDALVHRRLKELFQYGLVPVRQQEVIENEEIGLLKQYLENNEIRFLRPFGHRGQDLIGSKSAESEQDIQNAILNALHDATVRSKLSNLKTQSIETISNSYKDRQSEFSQSMSKEARLKLNESIWLEELERAAGRIPRSDVDIAKRIMKTFFAKHAFLGGLCEIFAQTPGKTNFLKNASDFQDAIHVASAAYCDFFTCDQRTRRSLDHFRGYFQFTILENPSKVGKKFFLESLNL